MLGKPSQQDAKNAIQSNYHRAVDRLIAMDVDGLSYNGTAPVDPLAAIWSAIQSWTVEYLNSNPNVAATELSRRIGELNSESAAETMFHLQASAIRLDTGETTLYVVAANFSHRGEAFIVRRLATAQYEVAWDIKTAAARSQSLELKYWLDSATFDWHISAPQTAEPHSLTPTRNGHLRFYLATGSNPWVGGTWAKQISIWEWDRNEAIPLLVKNYYVSFETSGFEENGNLLKIHTKEFPKTFSSCGECREPEAIWTLQITPDGVEDLGTEFEQPEYKLIDDLLYRTQRREPVTGLASDRVARKLRDIVPEVKGQMNNLGMLFALKTAQQNGREIADITIDGEYFSKLRFTFERRNGKLFATAVKRLE